MTKETKIAIAIYVTTLGILLYYNLTHPPVNDGVKEYEAYLLNIKQGWMFRRTLVNSCLTTTWLPAAIQRYTGIDQMALFRVFPTALYALMPVFIYLVARRYLAIRYALVACLVVVANSHILFFPDIGRVGVGIAFFAGMLWSLLERRLVWVIVFTLLVVFSHYGTALIAMGTALVCWAGYWIWKKRLLKRYLVVFCVLVVTIGVWHFWISSYSGWVMLTYGIQEDMPAMTKDIYGPETGWDAEVFADIRSREPAVQNALGIGVNSIPKAIEVATNWVVAGLTTLGLWVLLRNKNTESVIKIMALSLWSLIIFTVAIPWLSMFYGGMRVFFTALPVLAICFPLGVQRLSGWVRVSPVLLCVIALTLFALSTSGVVYLPFGMEKTVPVYWNLEDLGGVVP